MTTDHEPNLQAGTDEALVELGNARDHDLVDHLLTYRRPDEATAEIMAHLREQFIKLGHEIVNGVPRTADRNVALRSLHRACMDTIAALALNES